MTRILLQATLFLAISAAAGLIGNWLHPGGLDLGRDYFLADRVETAPDEPGPDEPRTNGSGAGTDDPAFGFQQVGIEDAKTWWEHSWSEDTGQWNEANGIFFLDARRKKSFDTRHIPGAFLADPWDREKEDIIDADLAERLRQAMAVIVYCNGGDCDDSKTVAVKLKFTHQVPEELISIYTGGFEEWRAAGLPTTEG